jgi:hypothetical protein
MLPARNRLLDCVKKFTGQEQFLAATIDMDRIDAPLTKTSKCKGTRSKIVEKQVKESDYSH